MMETARSNLWHTNSLLFLFPFLFFVLFRCVLNFILFLKPLTRILSFFSQFIIPRLIFASLETLCSVCMCSCAQCFDKKPFGLFCLEFWWKTLTIFRSFTHINLTSAIWFSFFLCVTIPTRNEKKRRRIKRVFFCYCNRSCMQSVYYEQSMYRNVVFMHFL